MKSKKQTLSAVVLAVLTVSVAAPVHAYPFEGVINALSNVFQQAAKYDEIEAAKAQPGRAARHANTTPQNLAKLALEKKQNFAVIAAAGLCGGGLFAAVLSKIANFSSPIKAVVAGLGAGLLPAGIWLGTNIAHANKQEAADVRPIGQPIATKVGDVVGDAAKRDVDNFVGLAKTIGNLFGSSSNN